MPSSREQNRNISDSVLDALAVSDGYRLRNIKFRRCIACDRADIRRSGSQVRDPHAAVRELNRSLQLSSQRFLFVLCIPNQRRRVAFLHAEVP
jgi:hypothetical protein